MQPAIRRYDGAEFRLVKRAGGKWFGSVSYTYSRLTGNYAGLTNYRSDAMEPSAVTLPTTAARSIFRP